MKRQVAELANVVSRLGEIDLGYPLDENRVSPPAPKKHLADFDRLFGSTLQQLHEFYLCCDGFSLPDVHVGYFVHQVALVLAGEHRGEPRAVSGEGGGAIVVFGSDGGGGSFAIRTDRVVGEVVYLPVGPVHDGVFDGINTPIRRLAASVADWLELVTEDVAAFIESRPGWKFMV